VLIQEHACVKTFDARKLHDTRGFSFALHKCVRIHTVVRVSYTTPLFGFVAGLSRVNHYRRRQIHRETMVFNGGVYLYHKMTSPPNLRYFWFIFEGWSQILPSTGVPPWIWTKLFRHGDWKSWRKRYSNMRVVYWDLVSPQRPPLDVRRYTCLPERVFSCLVA